MKTAIYIEDSVVQLVLTPENEFEKNAMRSFENKEISTKIFTGTFYDCRGGWTRQSAVYPHSPYGNNQEDRSLIVRVTSKAESC